MDRPDTNDMIAVIIRNHRGDFFVHQRASDKPMFPNLYGPGCGGHIRRGETPAQAAKRELREETGIEAEPTFVAEFPYKPGHTDYFFELITDEPIKPEEREWQWWGWKTRAGLEQLLAEGKIMPDTAQFLPQYFKTHTAP